MAVSSRQQTVQAWRSVCFSPIKAKRICNTNHAGSIWGANRIPTEKKIAPPTRISAEYAGQLQAPTVLVRFTERMPRKLITALTVAITAWYKPVINIYFQTYRVDLLLFLFNLAMNELAWKGCHNQWWSAVSPPLPGNRPQQKWKIKKQPNNLLDCFSKNNWIELYFSG